ncbi:MAG: hypothetical protein GC146_11715 [Limimaricola sp.]|uniref:hypothetical protein n=1 Tax=Limimaricola sp. TaxID=2211665 RepID=UPI001DF3DAD1|nr:hypothetical protein [Limimaricola sp.]MBI1417881.1 hypothetical protein [Limimaricola sp.]
MLFKNLISTYGSSLAAKSTPRDDPMWHLGGTEEHLNFRRYALDALQRAKVYLLDHAAAAYVDTLHDTIQETDTEADVAALTFLGEVELPGQVVWVEFDYRVLMAARVQRKSSSILDQQNPLGSGQRGYLIDDRDGEALNVTMFSCDSRGRVVDPFFTLRFAKSKENAGGLSSFQPMIHRHMADILSERGMTAQEIESRHQISLVDAASDLFIPYALFAMLVSPDLGGIIPTETVLYSPKEQKTARKFGKSWILGTQRSHLTIRIGPQAAAHLHERRARLEFERNVREGRSGPVRHWVSEHERHYRSGKVVLIRGHHRGQAPDPGLPTRVMGPRGPDVDFAVPVREQPDAD